MIAGRWYDLEVRKITDAPEIFDISPLLSERTAVFPQDVPFSRELTLDFESGNKNLLLSSIHTTVHLGAHTDAPNHYNPEGESIDQRSLAYYFGPCQVISVRLQPRERVRPEDIRNIDIMAARVLFKTESFPHPDRWNDDFNALSAELVEKLAAQQVVLVGIDTPSIDPADDEILESHHAAARHDLAILEGIVLSDVPDGFYTLVALPLRLQGADASPVRAVLIREGLRM
jgi:arylformamidase